jgi:ABC-type branched-subunit amino acid transport system substrate-binding protein
MVALSQKSGLTNAGDYIFRNSLLSNEQAKTIADYTLNKLRSKKIAILYPNSAYGTELANLFREEVKRGQGEVVAEEQYREGQTNFGNEVVRLFKIKETEKRDGRRKVKTFEKTVTADALYIPDYFDTVGLIAPHLAYYGIKNIKLLGSNGWNSPRLIELAGKYVEGAVFADSFFIDSKKESTEEFVYNFRSTYGMEPDILSAQAYDAVMMVVEAIEAAGEKREKIRDRLANLKDFRGVTGIITFNKDREAIKELFILTVKNGRIVELN